MKDQHKQERAADKQKDLDDAETERLNQEFNDEAMRVIGKQDGLTKDKNSLTLKLQAKEKELTTENAKSAPDAKAVKRLNEYITAYQESITALENEINAA